MDTDRNAKVKLNLAKWRECVCGGERQAVIETDKRDKNRWKIAHLQIS